jgi:hypothetical protein
MHEILFLGAKFVKEVPLGPRIPKSNFAVLFLDPKLFKEKATKFFLGWNLLNQNSSSLFLIEICMRNLKINK